MKKAFTLLELLIVIIIISILASVGFVQYGNMVERGRSAEARYILRRIRDAEEMYIIENEECTEDVSLLDIGAIPDTCESQTTHYFHYNVQCGAIDGYDIIATRCHNGEGKPPPADAPYTISFIVNRIAATCEETATGP